MKTITDLNGLVGEELNAVCFVMDYVEFHFNGPILRALSSVTLRQGSGGVAFPGPNSRDALCELIGSVVAEIHIREEQEIRLAFTDGEELRISVSEDDRPGPEAAHFVPGRNMPIQVW